MTLEVGFNLLDNRGKIGVRQHASAATTSPPSKAVGQKPYSDFDREQRQQLCRRPHSTSTGNPAWSWATARTATPNATSSATNFSVFNTYRDSVNWQNDLTLDEQQQPDPGRRLVRRPRSTAAPRSTKTAAGTAPRLSSIASTASSFPPSWACATTRTSSSAARTAGAAPSPYRSIPTTMCCSATGAKGFRAPTFNDLYYPDTKYSNPNLLARDVEELRATTAQPTRRPHGGWKPRPYRTDLSDAIILD